MTSGGGGSQNNEVAPVTEQQQPYNQQMQQGANPCEYEMREFMQCAQNQSDLSLCQGFNDVLRSCKARNGTFLYKKNLNAGILACVLFTGLPLN